MVVEESSSPSEDELLSQLLQALAAGVRAVQGVPLEDDFRFQSSFPEFAQALQQAQASLLDGLQAPLSILTDEDDQDRLVECDVNDPWLWEQCADACDLLIEQVQAHLENDTSAAVQLQHWSEQARRRSRKSLDRMLEGLVDMQKPQDTYGIVVQNDRLDPFVPNMRSKPFAMTPLGLALQPGHGLETRFGALRTVSLPNDMITPSHHVPHPYQTELERWTWRDWQLEAHKPETKMIPIEEDLQATWIDTAEQLTQLAQKLETVKEVALDLEAHSYRSFSGIVCLMQLSIRSDTDNMENYLIDTLKLHDHIHAALAPMLANPDIVKVMHGANSDVPWLQRDFGCYMVNLFDTGRAARALHFSSAGYAYLLQHYCGIAADKSHQLADWRQRPLPVAMQQYAIQDTHYLLDIYERLKYDLQQHADASIEEVLNFSRQVCLIRYAVEPFRPNGYHVLTKSGRSPQRHELNAVQERVLEALWDWRDATARQHDESLAYICPNPALLRIALACPMSVSALQSLFSPMPPLVMRLAQDLLDLIKRVKQQTLQEDNNKNDDAEGEEEEDEEVARQAVGAPSSAFFKPASTDEGRQLRSGMMSPVLGTEALYEQAGWMTPQSQEEDQAVVDEKDIVDVTTTTTDDDDPRENTTAKPRRLLSVHASNKDYRAKQHSGQGLELGKESSGNGRSVDGMGTVRVARESSLSPVSSSVEDDVKAARKTSALIRSGLSQKKTIPAVLGGLVSPTGEVDEDVDDEGNKIEPKDSDATEQEEEEFVIPRSMREIYKISNRNRRNKKAGSPTPERGVTPTNDKEREELAKAEALLKERGVMSYFDEIPAGKRPRTKSRTGRESEESVPQDISNIASKEDDIAFMTEIGWIEGSAEIEELSKRRKDEDLVEETREFASTEGKAKQATVNTGYDYSMAGPIGAMHPSQPANPFFQGASMSGGPLAQGFVTGKAEGAGPNPNRPDSRASRRNKSQGGRNSRKQQERPEKKDGRSHAYRMR